MNYATPNREVPKYEIDSILGLRIKATFCGGSRHGSRGGSRGGSRSGSGSRSAPDSRSPTVFCSCPCFCSCSCPCYPPSGSGELTGSIPLTEYSAEFDLKHTIRNSARVQPKATKIEGYEEANEPTLRRIIDDSCVIRDMHGEPLVVKIGAFPAASPAASSAPAIPLSLTEALFRRTLDYLTSASCTPDGIRHAKRAPNATPNATSNATPNAAPNAAATNAAPNAAATNAAATNAAAPKPLGQGGPDPPPPAHLGHCHHIHGQHCARNDAEIKNIQLMRGPTATWDGRVNNVKSYIE